MVGGTRLRARADLWRLEELRIAGDVELVDFDLAESGGIVRTLERLQPDEIYNLAAQSSVALSFERPLDTAEADAIGPLRLLEAIRQAVPRRGFFQASSCDMFGQATAAPQRRDDAVPAAQPYGDRQAVRALDHRRLPRAPRHRRQLRHPVQS